ncbi:hypothetical protein [Paracoccus aminophilus]|uniref:Uncharacterized protein n=1 Tax=Paracoccus aminophilus JCM 7686 TaxID=1367847 RepID=S5YEC8_PARAH|nr:hypothetical protein [Paracoccus aminophilus]AGT09848.1 hypothetical protein JCM7686_2792 [Paracoccus aminophilus JCM 7686]
MTDRNVASHSPTERLPALAEAVQAAGMISLQLQARANASHAPPGLFPALPASALARVAAEAQSSLQAAAHHDLQSLQPRSQALLTAIESLARSAIALDEGADLALGLRGLAVDLDHCRVEVRALTRAVAQQAEMIRVSEQKIWGALATELDRVEGPDGPLMASCERIEAIGLEIAGTARAAMTGLGISLSHCHEISAALCGLANRAVLLPRAKPEALTLDGPFVDFPELCQPVWALLGEYHALASEAQTVAIALALASRAAAQSNFSDDYAECLHLLEELFTSFAVEYRALAVAVLRKSRHDKAVARLAVDRRLWQAAADAVSEILRRDRAGDEGKRAILPADAQAA